MVVQEAEHFLWARKEWDHLAGRRTGYSVGLAATITDSCPLRPYARGPVSHSTGHRAGLERDLGGLPLRKQATEKEVALASVNGRVATRPQRGTERSWAFLPEQPLKQPPKRIQPDLTDFSGDW